MNIKFTPFGGWGGGGYQNQMFLKDSEGEGRDGDNFA